MPAVPIDGGVLELIWLWLVVSMLLVGAAVLFRAWKTKRARLRSRPDRADTKVAWLTSWLRDPYIIREAVRAGVITDAYHAQRIIEEIGDAPSEAHVDAVWYRLLSPVQVRRAVAIHIARDGVTYGYVGRVEALRKLNAFVDTIRRREAGLDVVSRVNHG